MACSAARRQQARPWQGPDASESSLHEIDVRDRIVLPYNGCLNQPGCDVGYELAITGVFIGVLLDLRLIGSTTIRLLLR